MAKKETLVKHSKQCTCNLSLNDLGLNTKVCSFLEDETAIPSDTYKRLVLFSPSAQSYLGIKLSKKILKHIDELVAEITSGLDVKHTYFFGSYTSKDKTKEDLGSKIKTDSKAFLCLYCSDNFTESLYASIRNSLAHGNIIKKDKYYYLFSVSSKHAGDVDDFNKPLSFLLRLHKLDKLSTYIHAFERYN